MQDKTYIRPKAAWNKVKAAQNIRQTVYIYGCTGMGKTSFMEDYLSRRIHLYYSLSDTGPEDVRLPERTDKESIIVVDDLHLAQTVEVREEWYALLEKLADDRNIWLVLISRAPIPGWLKPLYVEQAFSVLREELMLSDREAEDFFEAWQVFPAEAARERLKRLGPNYPLFLKLSAVVVY